MTFLYIAFFESKVFDFKQEKNAIFNLFDKSL